MSSRLKLCVCLLSVLLMSASVTIAADAAKKDAPAKVSAEVKPWSSLSSSQKSILSILETQWPKISLEHREEFIKGADSWGKMQPADQVALKQKMYKELGKKMP